MRAHEFLIIKRGLEPETSRVESENQPRLRHFVKWCCSELGIDTELPEIKFSDDKESARQHYTGYFRDHDNTIWIYSGQRNLIDIMRTLAHELTHFKQREDGVEMARQNYIGSPAEQAADVSAGILMKKYSRLFPEIIE